MPKTYSIVGPQSVEKVAGFEPGTPALLVREPANPYDPNAIAVHINGHHVGYIPRKQNSVLAQFIDQSGRTEVMAMDSKEHRTLPAIFRRSPNSRFPMVEVE